MNDDSSPVDLILSRLERVRNCGKGWIAKCPSHDDRTASLSVAEGDDGKVLLHCFAMCGIGDVVSALGLQLGDLFPRRCADTFDGRGFRRARDRLSTASVRAALNALEAESHVLLIAAGQLAERAESLDDRARLDKAVERIASARQTLYGRR